MAPPSASLLSCLLLLAAANWLPLTHVAATGRGLLEAPLVKDVAEFCSVQSKHCLHDDPVVFYITQPSGPTVCTHGGAF